MGSINASKETGTVEVFRERVVKARIEAESVRPENLKGNSGVLGRFTLFDFLKLSLTFVLFSWVPFYGYMYINSRLSGIGYESVFIGLDVWEAVHYFLISATSLFKITYLGSGFAIFCFVIGLVFFSLYMVAIFWERFQSKVDEISQKAGDAISSSRILIGVLISLSFSLSIYVLPIILFAAFTILFIFSALGNVNGMADGREVLVERSCIYGKKGSDCVVVSIRGEDKIGHVEYQNEKHTFFISNDGRYYLGPKGGVKQYKPFSLGLSNYSDKRVEFDSKVWSENIDKRWNMLQPVMEKIGHKKVKQGDIVKLLGNSESTKQLKFHYKEFPLYKLSTQIDCAIAFPYDWDTGVIVNTVVLGDCKGVLQ